MKGTTLRGRSISIYGSALLGVIMLAGAWWLLPSNALVMDVIRRATPLQPPPPAAPTLPIQTSAIRIPPAPPSAGIAGPKSSKVFELERLLAEGARTANADVLSALAVQLDRAGGPTPTIATTYNIIASGRHAVARAFLDRRPDKSQAALWRLRFALCRATNDANAALGLLQTAAHTPGASPPRDLIEAAYELNQPELIVVAAENGALARLDGPLSLDIARRAANAGRFDLVTRLDRVGTADWRRADPWLAMDFARRTGDTASALHFAALLPTGQAAAREAIILGSGDKQAVRAMLLDQAQAQPGERPLIAQKLLETGFRSDAMGLLRSEATGLTPNDPRVSRLLFLMGPRPDAEGLAWLQTRATQDPSWRKIYLERAQPNVALGFAEANSSDQDTAMLLTRMKLAADARDLKASVRALDLLLDGRVLTAQQLSAATAQTLPGMPTRFTLALARARVAAGAALDSDRRDLAWAAWNRNDYTEASSQLQAHLRLVPDDPDALMLMANVATRLKGKAAAKPWLERALTEAPPNSRQRVELLEQLNRNAEAIALVEAMRVKSPGDKSLAIVHSRLLIASGHPGRAQKALQP
jgi:tetratricopeptide (TPR) repeat protein